MIPSQYMMLKGKRGLGSMLIRERYEQSEIGKMFHRSHYMLVTAVSCLEGPA